MFKTLAITTISSAFLLSTTNSFAVPAVTGKPIEVQHLGKLVWPQDVDTTDPYLTQLVSNDVNDLHGELSCELIISTPGNYHMALKDAIYGATFDNQAGVSVTHVGLLEQVGTPEQFKVSICWSTSPPVSVDQIMFERLQFKNISMVGRPSLVMAPGGVMNKLVADGSADSTTVQPLFSNRGNVIIMRADKLNSITDICGLGAPTRVVTPHPMLEPGSFGNFSGTIFNVADLNKQTLTCDATALFTEIFSQNPLDYDTSSFDNPYDIDAIKSVFGKGTNAVGTGPRWVASSRIMHRDIPYALCHDEADAGVIFYHQALYMKETMAPTGCNLEILPLGGSVAIPEPLPGNKIGAIKIAKVNGSYPKKVNDARNDIYNFLTTDPMWDEILINHGMTP